MTTAEQGAAFIEHHGVMGMKWGIHRARTHLANGNVAKAHAILNKLGVHPDHVHFPVPTLKEAKADAEEHTKAKLFYGEGAGVRRRLIKAKVETKREKDPQYAKAFDHFVSKTDLAVRAVQARRTRKRKDVTKSAKRVGKKTGRFLSTVAESTAYQSDLTVLGKEFLSHHGVMGMKWGVRRTREVPSSTRVDTTTIIPYNKSRPTKISTEGGENHPAHPDALKVAASRQKYVKSGVHALSNQELRDMASRLQLETQVKTLTSSKGQQFVARELAKAERDPIGTAKKLHGAHRVAKGAFKVAAVAA
jgi:hypothetical protein